MSRKKEDKVKQNDKKAVLTFDYELALGVDSGTAIKCVLEPTDLILNILKKYSGIGIFFIDATYLLTLKKKKHKDFYIISDQIVRIVKSGHDIGLHLHPQWLDAYPIDSDRWGFKSHKKYRLHYLADREIDDLFKDSIRLLEKIINDSGNNYKINAFRAGGWSIQPFRLIKKHFKDNNIKLDFSINPGLSSKEKSISYYDFSKAPKDLSFWRFEDDPCNDIKSGSFIEIPVSTLKVKKIDLWISYYFYRKKEKEYNDGKTIYANDKMTKKGNKLKKIILGLFSKEYTNLSPDGLSHKYFIKFVEKLQKASMRNFLTLVCHPKNLTKDGIKNLEYILKNYETLTIKEIEKDVA